MRQMMLNRTERFKAMAGVDHPVLLAPMAGACPAALSAAIANAGGMGACGALLLSASQIEAWCAEFRAMSDGPFQINLWVPDPPPVRDSAHEAAVAAALSQWGPPVGEEAANAALVDFDSQVEAIIKARPTAFSTIMGIPSKEVIDAVKAAGILWFATVTTLTEALAAIEAGADALIAQGSEAGGHRGAFEAAFAETRAVGTFSLVPAVSALSDVPVIAAGGIGDGRTAVAALVLGASAVMAGSGFLRTPEAGLAPAWSQGMANARPEQTALTRGFSGRAGRSLRTRYVDAVETGDIPKPAPYPVQRGLTAAMRADAAKAGDISRMQAWAGQSAMLARDIPAAEIVTSIANDVAAYLAGT
jgi:nitronate monooxygenase